MTLTRQAGESFSIMLSLPNHLKISEMIQMPEPGQTIVFSRTLEKPFGTLAISSSPSGAKIIIDEKYRGTTPDTIGALRLDRQQLVRVELPGYQDMEQVVRWSSTTRSDSQELIFELTRIKPRRVVRRKRRSPPKKRPVTRRSETPKPRPSVERAPAPIRREKGDLVVQTRPWATVYLNGRVLARETPVSQRVEEGNYRLKVCFEGDNSRCLQRRIRIDAGRLTKERFKE